MRKRKFTSTLIVLAVAAVSFGDYKHLLQARDTSVSLLDENYIWSYGSFNDLAAHAGGTWDTIQMDVADTFKTVALAYDGKFRLMLQNRDTGEPNESYLWTFNTYTDLVNHTGGTWNQMMADIHEDYHTVALFYDGMYRMMLQNRDTSTGPPTETYLWSYSTYDDLVNHTGGSVVSLQSDIYDTFQTVGVAYDGKYRMMLQDKDTGASPPVETYIWTYDTLDQLLNHTGGTFVSAQFDVASDYRTVGFCYVPVPEPSSVVALGLGSLAFLRRRRRSSH